MLTHLENPQLTRRNADRVKCVRDVEIDFSDSATCRAKTLNLSSSGARLILPFSVEHGSELVVRLRVSGENLRIPAKAVWQYCLGTLGTHVLGVEFAEDHSAFFPTGNRAA